MFCRTRWSWLIWHLLPGETLALTFQFEDAPVGILQKKFFIKLHSDILLEGQQIMMPTITDSTELSEPTSLFWDIQCPYENTPVQIGASIFDDLAEMDCYCALDTHLYTSSGEKCNPPQ